MGVLKDASLRIFFSTVNTSTNYSATSRQVAALGARIGQLPSRKSRYLQSSSSLQLVELETRDQFFHEFEATPI